MAQKHFLTAMPICELRREKTYVKVHALVLVLRGSRKSLPLLYLTLRLLTTTCTVLANSVDPDQLASEEAN